MFNFLKSKNLSKDSDFIEDDSKKSWLGQLKQGLKRTRTQFVDKFSDLLLGKKTIDQDLFEELETILLSADIGVDVTQKILQQLTSNIKRKELTDPQILNSMLKEILLNLLQPYSQPLNLTAKPAIILMVGVNGAGKTTTIAKLAHLYKQQNKKIMIAAGDTFRAAAIEQLQVWGERNQVPVVAQHSGADSASVIFDAMQAATARGFDLLIADTAGRLHTQDHLMQELQKIKRVMGKIDNQAPHETLLVIDASMGQNALNQAQQFHSSVGLTGIAVTKLDGTAKGGMIFAITEKMKLPIRFIGIGEQIDDLKPFDAKEFVAALFE